jgi:hypothetical protein
MPAAGGLEGGQMPDGQQVYFINAMVRPTADGYTFTCQQSGQMVYVVNGTWRTRRQFLDCQRGGQTIYIVGLHCIPEGDGYRIGCQQSGQQIYLKGCELTRIGDDFLISCKRDGQAVYM